MAKAPKAEKKILPVAALREYATAVEAGIALVLADPEKRSVHKLRTATRRVEAQLTLLALLDAGGTPAEEGGGKGPAPKKLLKLLSAVRRACGVVRDYDVQADMIAEAVGAEADEALGDAAKEVSDWLHGKRAGAAAALVEELQGHSHLLGPKMEEMMKHLKSREEETISQAKLQELTAGLYAGRTAPLAGKDGEKALHDIRKVAKMCRYLLEASGGLRKAAAAFETVQEAGGVWHDNLGLRVTVGKRLGKKAPLTRLFRERERQGLAAYKVLLERSPSVPGRAEKPAGVS